MSSDDSLRLQIDGPIATLTLNRPDKLNAMGAQTRALFGAHLQRVADDAGVRVLLLNAEGRAFCAGADLGSLPTTALDWRERVIAAQRQHQLMATMNPVVIAAVQGAAAGGGAALALAADILLMADDACLRFPFVRLGLIPDGGMAFLLQAKAGTAMALDLLLSGGVMAAAEAFACGLTRRVVPPDRLAPQARALAEELARLPAQSLLLTKSLMRQTWAARMPGALAHEADAFALVTALPGHAQAMARMRPQTRASAKENG
ncbi:enoyl-CoA hydratase/isomerase family protein [Verminephrobacter eiseniae]|uniref:enoyl-CoA hydratase/isomerase family protein n=1 Tax=Verminephrobacter eiseniae TaxID=364317 RepID=UPI002239113C|nr:enoyl-CoA hydratase-related protein [Verminephrobacter eiseniae]MCW5261222.1 enoyl-CoA hydratase/isomerase family protein [Verminephrobacter eiseniae]